MSYQESVNDVFGRRRVVESKPSLITDERPFEIELDDIELPESIEGLSEEEVIQLYENFVYVPEDDLGDLGTQVYATFREWVKVESTTSAAAADVSANGHSQQVADTILRQIRAMDRWAIGAWGAKNVFAFKKGVHFGLTKAVGPGIQMDVRGSKHKGRVLIGLDEGRDLYDIVLYTLRRSKKNPLGIKLKSVTRGVFADQLVSTLDDLIG
tara:strand:- start:155 stop:787 length:633 start_codon:yes stop_codon:yes gene_type:complete